MGVTATTRLPAGWYPDPDGGNQRRWWDGREWTQYTAEFQRPTSVEDLAIASEPQPEPEPQETAPQRRAVAQRIGRLLAGLVHAAPSAKRAHKHRRAHRLNR